MSWVDVVKKALEGLDAAISDTVKGNLVVESADRDNFKAFILARRLQFSFDRKLEVVGVWELPRAGIGAEDLKKQLFWMLSNSIEIELGGLFKKKVRFREWGELRYLRKMLGGFPLSNELKRYLEGNQHLQERILESSPELVEIFPRLIPPRFLEFYFLSSGRGFAIDRMVKRYIDSVESNAWIVRLHLMYGTPKMGEKVRKNYLLVLKIAEEMEKATNELFLI
ncbi:MAG TPA: hypothetical protein ENJ59_00960 [Thermofilum sp.]|nr:hypothetical protein [Thermofilum sp.]